jgi:hypothetical protein
MLQWSNYVNRDSITAVQKTMKLSAVEGRFIFFIYAIFSSVANITFGVK